MRQFQTLSETHLNNFRKSKYKAELVQQVEVSSAMLNLIKMKNSFFQNFPYLLTNSDSQLDVISGDVWRGQYLPSYWPVSAQTGSCRDGEVPLQLLATQSFGF